MKAIRRSAGFTLMELMIVVVIIGILAAIVIPNLLSVAEKKRHMEEAGPPSGTEAGPSTPAAPVPAEPEAAPRAVTPVTEAADIRIRLSASSYIRRLKVYTLFTADFEGTYTFTGPGDGTDPVRIEFPFPGSATQARDVSLEISRDGETFFEPEAARYTLGGIRWTGELAGGERLDARVSYSVQGADRYVYQGPGAGRAGSLRIVMTLAGITSEFIPADALQPTRIEEDRLIWDFENLITDRRIMVELPGTMSPTGRAILFLRLAGLAVLLFGLGFIYLNDLKEPGRLDHFRWGHFLLLALTYSLFFIIFTALHLGQHMGAWAALLLSALLSLPLLMIHVSRFWGARFALLWILPLAVFTLAIVINGVYGGPYRTYIYIGLTVLAAAFFTLTYQTWAEKRKAHRAEKERRYREDREAALREEENRKEEARRKAWRKSRIDKATSAVDRLAEQWRRTENLVEEAELMPDRVGGDDGSEIRAAVAQAVVDLAKQEDPVGDLRGTVNELEAISEDDAFSAAVEAFRSNTEKERRRIQAAADELEEALSVLKQQHEREKADALRREDAIHCLACGAGYTLSNFCPHCGVRSPERLTCSRCGETYLLPVHLLGETESTEPLHCMVCGHPHESK